MEISIYSFSIQHLWTFLGLFIHIDAANRMSINFPSNADKEFCKIDFQIIEELQSNQMETDNVAIFTDDNIYSSENAHKMFRLLANGKVFTVQQISQPISKNGINGNKHGRFHNVQKINEKNIKNSNGRRDVHASEHNEINFTNKTSEKFELSKSFSLAFLLGSAKDSLDTFNVMMKYPSLVKIVLNYMECSYNKTMYIDQLQLFAKKLWIEYRVLHIYFIPFCWCNRTLSSGICDGTATTIAGKMENCFLSDIYFYDPFEWNTVQNERGLVKEFTLNRRADPASNYKTTDKMIHRTTHLPVTTNTTDTFNEILQQKKFLNLNQMILNVSFLPSTTTYVGADIADCVANVSLLLAEGKCRKSTKSHLGIDIELLRELSKKINFTPHIIDPSDGTYYGFREQNGSFNGALGDVLYKRTEFIINAIFIKDYETRDLEFSTYVYHDKLCVVVRSADLIPNSLLLLAIFSKEVWITIALTLVIVSGLYVLFTGDRNGITGHEELAPTPAFYTKLSNEISKSYRIIGILLMQPVHGVRALPSERIFVLACLLWALIINGTFQSSLINVYNHPSSYEDIDTLEGVDEKNIMLGLSHLGLAVDVFGNATPDTTLGRLKRKIIPISLDKDIFAQIAENGDISTLERKQNERLLSMRFNRPTGQVLLHFVKECPKSYSLALVLPKSSVFSDPMNYIIGILQEAGLVNKWHTDFMFSYELQNNVKRNQFLQSGQVILTLKHLKISFILLGIGLAISFVIFLVEILLKRVMRKKNMEILKF